MSAAAISDAKSAMAAGDYAAALAHFGKVDLSQLDTMAAVRVQRQMASSAAALHQASVSTAHHQAALERLRADGLLAPEHLTQDTAKLALNLAVGAGDTAMAVKYLRLIWGPPPPHAASFKISPVIDIRTWCAAHGIAITLLDSAQDIVVPDGRGLGENLRYRCEKTWHATIPNAQIVAGWDFPFTAAGEILAGPNYMPVEKSFPFMPHGYCDTAPAAVHVWSETTIRIEDDALFLSAPHDHHYGHWVSEFLPRLRAWDTGEAPRRKLVISAALPRKHRDLLARFGATSDDLIESRPGQCYSFRSLRVVSAGRPNGPTPRSVKYLSVMLRPPADASGTDILFLEREAGTRKPVNIGELTALFQEFGVRTVNPARLSAAEQFEIFAKAKAIIGAFGTELFCLYNLPRGAAVIELHWNLPDADVYGPASNLIGLTHHLIMCAKAADRGNANTKQDGDIVVDCAALRERLAALTSR